MTARTTTAVQRVDVWRGLAATMIAEATVVAKAERIGDFLGVMGDLRSVEAL